MHLDFCCFHQSDWIRVNSRKFLFLIKYLEIILTIAKQSDRQMGTEEEAKLRVGWLNMLLFNRTD